MNEAFECVSDDSFKCVAVSLFTHYKYEYDYCYGCGYGCGYGYRPYQILDNLFH